MFVLCRPQDEPAPAEEPGESVEGDTCEAVVCVEGDPCEGDVHVPVDTTNNNVLDSKTECKPVETCEGGDSGEGGDPGEAVKQSEGSPSGEVSGKRGRRRQKFKPTS